MDWFNKTGILLALMTLFLMGCATSEPVAKGSFPSAIVPSTSPTSEENQLKCNAGELTTCITRYRVSDGRHGRKNNERSKLYVSSREYCFIFTTQHDAIFSIARLSNNHLMFKCYLNQD